MPLGGTGVRSEGSVCREPSWTERGNGSHTPCPPKSSPVSIRCSFLLGFRVIFGRSFGHVFFHQAPTERGRKAEPPVLQPLPLTPGRRHPRVSPQLLCISLLHLRPLFHELHVSVQQVQTPLRVPLEYLKLILAGRLGGPRSGPGDPTAADPAAGEPPGSKLQEGVASRPRPGAARGGRQETGGNPLPFPGRARELGRGPSRTTGSPLQAPRRGVEWGKATPPAPGPLIPPDSGKSGRPGVSQGQRGRVPCSLGGPQNGRSAGIRFPRSPRFPGSPQGRLSFPY